MNNINTSSYPPSMVGDWKGHKVLILDENTGTGEVLIQFAFDTLAPHEERWVPAGEVTRGS